MIERFRLAAANRRVLLPEKRKPPLPPRLSGKAAASDAKLLTLLATLRVVLPTAAGRLPGRARIARPLRRRGACALVARRLLSTRAALAALLPAIALAHADLHFRRAQRAGAEIMITPPSVDKCARFQ